MVDLAAAIAALQDLQSDDVTVTADGNRASIVIRYLDTAPTGALRQEKASHVFTVDFDTDSGEYKLSSTRHSSESGLTGGGLSIQKNSGTTKSFSFSAQAGPGGSVTSTFNSAPWEESIRQRVESAGWTRKKGLFGKLFGG